MVAQLVEGALQHRFPLRVDAGNDGLQLAQRRAKAPDADAQLMNQLLVVSSGFGNPTCVLQDLGKTALQCGGDE